MVESTNKRFDVGGLTLERPFRLRRLGHFGFYGRDMEKSLSFYRDLLGFQVTDTLDIGARARDPAELEGLGDTHGYFMRYGTDHHAFVLFPYRVRKAIDYDKRMADDVTINQITWQVGSPREVRNATDWFGETGVDYHRTGRDVPGSNWHVYPIDPDGHINELFYGIEQVGWDGLSKPRELFDREFTTAPELPWIREAEEVENARKRQVDLGSGTNSLELGTAEYDVGGIRLPRPFKITGIGPVRLFTERPGNALAFYRDRLGLTLTETVVWQGRECHFLRCGTEHHALALYPMELREELGLTDWSSCMSFGVRVNDYAQLRDAIAFLERNGVEIRYLPPALSTGIDYSAFAIDPDGHVVELYYYMEQIGWDGRPRPADQRRRTDNGAWPETLEPLSDSFTGEQFLGPWG